MKIKNESKWETRDIARLIRRVASEELNPEDLRRLQVVVRAGDSLGRATIGCGRLGVRGRWMSLNLNRCRTKTPVMGRHALAPELVEKMRAAGMEVRADDEGTVWCEHVERYERGPLDLVLVAHVIAHEMAHLRGMDHAKMKGDTRYDYAPGWRYRYAWATEFPIRERQAKQRDPEAEIERKLARAEEALAAYQRKIKLATTLMKKWQRRHRHYQKRLAACRAQPKT